MIVVVPVVQMQGKTQQGVNTHAQHVVSTVEVERPKIIKQTGQKTIIQEKINHVTKQVEVPLSQFNDKVVDIPVVALRQISQMQVDDEVVDVPVVSVVQVPRVCAVKNTAEIPQLLVVDVPVVVVEQVPHVHVVEKTVEDPQFQIIEKIGEIPEWLNFVRENFPVYILRETLRQNKILRVVKKTLVKSRLEMLAEIECDEGHEFMLQGNDSVSVAKDVVDEANEESEMSPDCMVCSSASGCTRQQHKQRATNRQHKEKEQGREEREKGRKGQRGRAQEGRKNEEREAEEGGGELVEKDVTGWTEVTRNKRKKMVQMFVKVDGMKTVAMEASPEDKVQKILNTVSGSDRDVYVTSGGRILRGSDKLKSCDVRDGSTVEVTSRMRGGGGKHREKKSKKEKGVEARRRLSRRMDRKRRFSPASM